MSTQQPAILRQATVVKIADCSKVENSHRSFHRYGGHIDFAHKAAIMLIKMIHFIAVIIAQLSQ